MPVDLIAGLGIFKSLYNSAKALKDINDATVRNGAIIELQEKILSAREAQSALLERISELEKQATRFETWEAEKQNYEMKRLASGSIVYALKPEIQGATPARYICTNCYEHRIKSLLQKKPEDRASKSLGKPPMYICPQCKSEFMP